jgi:hypothetical protein
VFQSLVADLRSGAYRTADSYQRRALLKRGPEAGGGLLPPRYLVLIPGKLLLMASSQSAVPLAALSLAEGARVGVRVSAAAVARVSSRAGAEAGEGAGLAVLEVTVRGRRHVLRMPSTVGHFQLVTRVESSWIYGL